MALRDEQLKRGVRYSMPEKKRGVKGAHLRLHYVYEVPLHYIQFVKGGNDLLHQRVASVSAHSLFFTIAATLPVKGGHTVYVCFESLAQHYKVTPSAIYRQFKCLLKGDVLRRVKKGQYLVHPHIVFSGDNEAWNTACTQWETGIVPKPVLVRPYGMQKEQP